MMDGEGSLPGSQDIREAAQHLVDARKNGRPLAEIPTGLAPRSVAQAYVIQDEIISHLGEVGDWKQVEMSVTPLAMQIDGREVGSVPGGTSSHHVFAALTWLANHAVARSGGLRAGQVIITGARVGPVAVTAGAQVTGAAGMLGELGTVV